MKGKEKILSWPKRVYFATSFLLRLLEAIPWLLKKSAVELLKLLHLKSTCFTLLNKVIKFHHEILQTLAAQTHPEILRFDTDTNAVVTISG